MFKTTTNPKQPTNLEMSCSIVLHFVSKDLVGLLTLIVNLRFL